MRNHFRGQKDNISTQYHQSKEKYEKNYTHSSFSGFVQKHGMRKIGPTNIVVSKFNAQTGGISTVQQHNLYGMVKGVPMMKNTYRAADYDGYAKKGSMNLMNLRI